MTGAASVVATALIYSGRPNPSWPISPPGGDAVLAALLAMPRLAGPCHDGGGLGYSGVGVEITGRGGARRYWSLYRGVATSADGCFADPDRRIERMIATTVPASILAAHDALRNTGSAFPHRGY